MKPADAEPVCEACGASEGLRHTHFGWLCNDVRACMERVGGPAWVAGDDLPEVNVKKVIVIGPHNREEITDPEAVKAFEGLMRSARAVDLTALDPLHPTGRCTCGGDGACEWCLSHCIHCGSYAWPFDEADMEDYEALGYKETVVTEAHLDNPFSLAVIIGRYSGMWAGHIGLAVDMPLRASLSDMENELEKDMDCG